MRWRQRFPIYPLPHTCVASPFVNIFYQSDAFVTIDKPTLTQHYHSESIVCKMLLFDVAHSMGLGKCAKCIHNVASYRVFYYPKTSLCSTYAALPHSWPLIFLLCIVLPSPECHIMKSQCIAFSGSIFHRVVYIYVSFMSFHGFIATFFVLWNTISLSGRQEVREGKD